MWAAPARSAQVATAYRGDNIHSLWATETDQQMEQDLQDSKNAGANVVRLDIAWATLDSTGPGQLTPWYSDRLNAFMAEANQLGIKVVGLLFTTPCWASSAPASLTQGCQGDWWDRGVGWYPPTNDQDFADFVRYITSTYGSELAAVEIWNEPDNPSGSYFTSSNPVADYAALLKAAYPAAKEGDPNVPVLAGSLAGTDVTFLQQLYAAGIQGYYDGIAVHAYCGTDAPGATPAGGDIRFEFQAGLEAIHALQLQHGDTTPIWVTEFGWDSVDTPAQTGATYLEQAYQIMAGMPYVRAGIVYELHDDIGASGPGASYGLLNQDYSPKPAYAAFTAVMTPPAAPVLTSPVGGSVVTTAHPVLTFTAQPGATVAVSVDGVQVGVATANGVGAASLTDPTALADGSHSVSAIQTDVYGNVGPVSASATFTVTVTVVTATTPHTGRSPAPVASVAAVRALRLRVAGSHRRTVSVRCAVTTGTMTRCTVTAYAHGRRIGVGHISMGRSGHRIGLVRVHLTTLGLHDERLSRGHLHVTLRGAATLSGGGTLASRRTLTA